MIFINYKQMIDGAIKIDCWLTADMFLHWNNITKGSKKNDRT